MVFSAVAFQKLREFILTVLPRTFHEIFRVEILNYSSGCRRRVGCSAPFGFINRKPIYITFNLAR